MSQVQPSDQRDRQVLVAAVAALRRELPLQHETQLIDIALVSYESMERIFQLAEGHVAVVVVRLHYDAAYRGDGPPPPIPGLGNHVLSHAGDVVRSCVRACDLVVRAGQSDVAVVLLQAGPLEARSQVGRLRAATADQRFTYRGYEIRWRGWLGLATYQGAAVPQRPRKVLEDLFASAS